MACYDCEDCNKHHSRGGKCPLWESDCPFDEIIIDKEEQKRVKETINYLNNEIEHYYKIKDCKYSTDYDEIISSFNHAISVLEDSIDEEMIELHKIVYEEEYK